MVASVLGHGAIRQYDDSIGVRNGGQTVGDDDRGASPSGFQQGRIDLCLTDDGVQVGYRFVQNQDGTVFQDCPGQCDPLALAARNCAMNTPWAT